MFDDIFAILRSSISAAFSWFDQLINSMGVQFWYTILIAFTMYLTFKFILHPLTGQSDSVSVFGHRSRSDRAYDQRKADFESRYGTGGGGH